MVVHIGGVISCNTGISANRIIAQTGKDPDTGNKVIDLIQINMLFQVKILMQMD